MAIGLLIHPTGCSTAQPSSNVSAEAGQTQHHTQCKAFSTCLKDAVKNTKDEQAPSLSGAGKPIEPTVDGHAAGAIGTETGSHAKAPNGQEVATPADDHAEAVPTTDVKASVNPNSNSHSHSNSNPIPAEPTVQTNASISPLVIAPTVVATSNDGTQDHEPLATNPPQAKTTVSSSASPPLSALIPNSSSEVPAAQIETPITNKLVIRNGRGASAQLVPVPLEQLSEASSPSGMRLPSIQISDQGPSPTVENQRSTNLIPMAQGNGVVHSLVQPSIDIRPSAMIQPQGDHETTLLSQSQSVRVIQDSGDWEQGSFGNSAQGEGEGSGFQFNASGVPESVIRGNQSPIFSDQFALARQIQSLPQGMGSPIVMSTTDHLKLTQSLTGGEHSAVMTSTGMPQTIHLELPSHDSGPLNVRISMTDQTVHTQFTTDRSDLGALLFMRQDQLQQTLTRSGLELGQFQVHVNQEGRQDALPDRQSRRNDGTPEQQLASQDHNLQGQDRERPNHRPIRTLSLFA